MTKRKTERIHYLDSIRGLAALTVAIFHFIGWKWADEMPFKLAMFVFNGNDAVSFFFVLSGFVLSYPYLHSDRVIRFGNYVWKRILRLYPAFIVNILILFCYWNRNALLDDFWGTLYNGFVHNAHPRVLNELAMVLNVHELYLPGWTLRIEMIYSIIMVALVMITKYKKEGLILIWLASFFIGEPKTRMFMTHFILGIILAIYYPRLKNMQFSDTRFYPYRYLIFPIIAVLYSFRCFIPLVPFVKDSFDFLWVYNIRCEHFSGLATFFMLVLIAMNKPFQDFLVKKWLLFLGKISYSVYLIHWVLVLIIMDHWEYWGTYLGTSYFRFYFLLAVFLFLTIFLANLLYKYIELPFMLWSKRKR